MASAEILLEGVEVIYRGLHTGEYNYETASHLLDFYKVEAEIEKLKVLQQIEVRLMRLVEVTEGV
jgi:hypothetical protein